MNSTAFGSYTKASGKNSTAFGDTTEARGENATAWGIKAKAYGVNSTSFGANTVADGHGATAFGGSSMALGFCNTAWGYATQAGQLLYGSDKKVAYIVDYKEGETTKYKIVDYNSEEKKTLKDGFNSYWDAYSECEVKDVDQATAWGSGAKATDWHATAFGFETIASGKRSTAFGQKSEASGESATAWGGYFDGNVYKGGTASGTASTAFGVETIANTKGSTAWGDQTLAGKATIDGTEYSGTYATAFGYGTKASGTYATAFGSLTTASGPVATAWGVGTKASGNRSTAFGDNTTASGFAATAWGTFAIASGKASTAFGDSSQAMAENSLAALGGIVEKDATNGVAIGKGAKVKVADAVALGSGSVADTADTISVGSSSLQRKIVNVAAGTADTDAVNLKQLSDKLDKTEFNAYKEATASTISTMNTAIKKNADDISDLQTGKLDKAVYEADKADTKAALDGKANVALDNITEDGKTVIKDLAKEAINVVGDAPISVVKSDVGGVDTYTVSVKTDGKVESGDEGIMTGGKVFTETRVSADGNYIKSADSAAKNLEALDTAVGTTADGNYVKASDSVGENLGALDAELAALTAGTGTGLAEVSHRIDNMDSKVEKVGAGAAALAALHPMDTDGKFSMAAGFGNYRSANAMALGVFYRPTDQVMFSMGGSMGNGENMINAGVSFALDKGISTSKAAMARTIKAQGEKISEQDAKIQTLEAENAKLAERLAAIEAKLGK